MNFRIRFFFLFLSVAFCANPILFAVKTVERFYIHTDEGAQVDPNVIAENLARYTNHFHTQINGQKGTNNIASGALTVMYRNKDDSTDMVPHTFYFDEADGQQRHMIIFESSPVSSEDNDLVPWGNTALGFLHGYAGGIRQDHTIKALSFSVLQDFINKMCANETSQVMQDETSQVMQDKTPKVMQELHSALQKIAAILSEAAAQKLSNPIAQVLEVGIELESGDASLSNTSLDSFHITAQAVHKVDDLQEHLDLMIAKDAALAPSQDALMESLKQIKETATTLYRFCWHSEIRLLYYLYANGLSSNDDTPSLDESSSQESGGFTWEETSSTSALQAPKGSLSERILSVGGDQYEPIYGFLHVHSFRDFCPMCHELLDKYAAGAFQNMSSLGDFELRAVFGSYTQPYKHSPDGQESPSPHLWLKKI